MNLRFIYTILLLFFTVTLFCQDMIIKKDSAKKDVRVGDYIKLNVQCGAVINNAYSNLQRHNLESGHTSYEEYSSYDKNKYNSNFNIGFNFLFGRSPYVKHVIGINYLLSKGEFNYEYGQGGYISYHEDFHYISKIDFINLTTGLRFTIGKNFRIEPLISFNYIANADIKLSGTATTTTISGSPNQSLIGSETVYYTNTKVGYEHAKIHHTISLCPKASYEFNVKNQKLGVYISYNFAFDFRLPWYMLGITYYPFKNLR